jgi:hypothetical protein
LISFVDSIVGEGDGIVFNGATVKVHGLFLPRSFKQNAGEVYFDNGDIMKNHYDKSLLWFNNVEMSGDQLHFLPSLRWVRIDNFNPNGGATNFYGQTVVNTMGLSGDSSVRVWNSASCCIEVLTLEDSSSLLIDETARVNVHYRFAWKGDQGSSIASASGVDGTLHLLQNSVSQITTSGNDHQLSNVQLHNYGRLNYNPTNRGIALNGTSKIYNHQGAVFNVSAPHQVKLDAEGNPSDHTFENQGLLSLHGDANQNPFVISSDFVNYGTVDVGKRSLDLASSHHQYNGTTKLNGGRIQVDEFNLNGGSITGHGSIEGAVKQRGGRMSPRKGRLSMESLDQQAKGVLEIEVGDSSDYSSIEVQGPAHIEGKLIVEPVDGYVPSAGTNLRDVVTANPVDGAFSSEYGPDMTVEASYQPGAIDVDIPSVGTSPFTCSSGCVHGECIGQDTCLCEDGYTGSNCDKFHCPLGCQKGRCVGPNQCECFPGTVGVACDIQGPRECFINATFHTIETCLAPSNGLYHCINVTAPEMVSPIPLLCIILI